MSLVDAVKQAAIDLWDPVGARIRYLKVGLPGPGGDDPRETVLDVPGYYQMQRYTCGFTAGLMILHTFHPRRSPERFFRDVAPDPSMGTSTTRLIRALRRSRIGVATFDTFTFDAAAQRIRLVDHLAVIGTDRRDHPGIRRREPGEHVEGALGVVETLRALPSGHALMTLGLVLGVATPIMRSLLLAGWFARRGERAMAVIALAVVAIVLSGLLLRH